ncbi:MAG: murein DD-endopeptidase MepM/ murein hydrolase activator NlpD [Acidimicrobiales bacterium]
MSSADRWTPPARAGLIVIVAVLASLLLTSGSATAQAPLVRESVYYAAPLPTQVIDPFRPPAHIGAEGNRGLEYGTSDNQVVAVAASGYVLFAGPVAGRKAISVVHADGVRTTYTGLLEIWVVEGMTVNQHSAIALASTGFHFGARVNDHYLDPQILIDASDVEVRARLVPAPD